MADHDPNTPVRAEDVFSVGSRVSWGAIMAGAVVALTTHFVLALLGALVGLSARNNVETDTLQTGALVWAVGSALVALFAGGWVTSQCTVGENRAEAGVHGVIMWAVVSALMLFMSAAGIRAGFNAMMSIANTGAVAAQNQTAGQGWEDAARQAGINPDQIAAVRQRMGDAPARAREAVQDQQTREEAADAVTRATGWTLLGVLLSMAASVLGAIAGAGQSFRLIPVHRHPVGPTAAMPH